MTPRSPNHHRPRLLPPDESGLTQAAAILRSGGLVAFPTESSFGIAAATDRPNALERIVQVKQRPERNPFPILVTSRQQAEDLIGPLTGAAAQMADLHWPGPLTLVGPPSRPLHPTLVSDLGAGVRMPGLDLARLLVELTGRPITATSANVSGRPPAMTPSEAAALSGLDAVIDVPAAGGPPSTVAAVRTWGLQILRQGPVEIPARLQVTEDTIFKGAVTILQPAQGYRFSVDALLLAAFGAGLVNVESRRPLLAADLGSATGVVALALRHLLLNAANHEPDDEPHRTVHDSAHDSAHNRLQIWAIEVQKRLADLARLNADLAMTSDASAPVRVLHQDLTAKADTPPAGRLDLVLSNPPYRRRGSGRPSPDRERQVALTEEEATIDQVAASAARLLKPGGLAAFVYPTERLADLFSALASAGLRPTVLRPLLPHAGKPSHRVLLAAVKGRPQAPLRMDPPMVLHEPSGADSPDLAAILEGRLA